ncbi:hypothetical protein [Streptomyces sp. NPDC000888]
MSANPEGPLRLPASAVPEGCRPWDVEGARRWTRALPPRWASARTSSGYVVAVSALALAAAFFVMTLADLRPWFAALCALHVVWVLMRPEVVRVSAPALVVVLVMQRPALPWAVTVPVIAALVVSWMVASVRLGARARQREVARAAADGVTAPLPDAGKPLARGKFLLGAGLVLSVLGGALLLTAGLWGLADDRQGARLVGCFAVGLGLTVSLSGWLGRRRATVLRRGAAPVLRVLVREDKDGDTEVFAADDPEALRPLFTVSLRDLDDSDDGDDECGEDEGLDELLGRLDGDAPGVLREGVLYGAAHEGAEVFVVSAAEEADAPPVAQWSTGPVRPLSEGAVRRRGAAVRRAAAREAAYEERRGAMVAAVAVSEVTGGAVRRWRAGWVDWLTCAVLVLWGTSIALGDSGSWRYLLAVVIGFIGALCLPGIAAWRITADSSGLWVSGLRRSRHIEWDHIRVVRCRGTELKLDSDRAGFDAWLVQGPRWPWLERKLRLVHPYERTAAEITAMWQDPALRPAGTSSDRERGRPLWPLAVLGAVVWAVCLVVWGR